MLLLELLEHAPAQRRQSKQRQRDVAQDRVVGEQRNDLIGPRHAKMRTAMRRNPGDVPVEQPDRAGVGGDLAGDQVEQGGLAGPVGTDDQAALTWLDRQVDIGGDAQSAELLAEIADGERGQGLSSSLGGAAVAPKRVACHSQRASRTEPGTRPSGMKVMMRTKITPSTRFQRST